jgi:DUF1680 family protein
LDIAIKYADCAVREVGDKPGQMMVVSGHQIAEMALSKLYLVTGNINYLNLAKLLLDKRGHTLVKEEYSQSHKPVLEQDEAVGHAVRAAYMYSGMADVARLLATKGISKQLTEFGIILLAKSYTLQAVSVLQITAKHLVTTTNYPICRHIAKPVRRLAMCT